jgi:glycosyltransferase involved in cell wall biosynthesis
MTLRSRPKRVLHVIDSFDLGGAQTFLLDLVRHLDPTLFVPEVAAMHGHGVFEQAFHESGITTHSLSPSKFPPLYLPNFWRLMRLGDFDILHFHLFGANLCAKPLAIAAGHRALIVHDQCNDASRDNSLLLLSADALANRGASRVIAVSESVRRYLLNREDLADSRVEMVPNGIDAGQFTPGDERRKREARERMELPEGCFLIGGVGRLVAQKNFSLFLQSASALSLRHPEAFFVIAGSGPLESQLRREADALGISGRIRFLGHVTDRMGLYHALDALMLTSDFEGTPMTLLEAMASGVPVVASRVDGIAEVCTHDADALLVPRRDLGGFVGALENLVTDTGLREALGRNARRTILARYEIRKIARRIEGIYADVLEKQTSGY